MMQRLFHVVVINEKTGKKVYMTQTPVTHSEACMKWLGCMICP